MFDLQRLRRRATERGFATGGFTTRGFTMIELLVVLSIVMILSSIALIQYRTSVTAAKEAVLRSDLHLMRDAIDLTPRRWATYPSSLDSLVSEGYLFAIPDDPFNHGRKDDWVTTPSDPDPNNPTAATGISRRQALEPGHRTRRVQCARTGNALRYVIVVSSQRRHASVLHRAAGLARMANLFTKTNREAVKGVKDSREAARRAKTLMIWYRAV